MSNPNNPCLFCNPKKTGIAHENDFAYASYDTYPVSKNHCLIIPKRHIKDYFDLTNQELISCNDLIKIVKKEILDQDKLVKGLQLEIDFLEQKEKFGKEDEKQLDRLVTKQDAIVDLLDQYNKGLITAQELQKGLV